MQIHQRRHALTDGYNGTHVGTLFEWGGGTCASGEES
jgi:hypothetical protein